MFANPRSRLRGSSSFWFGYLTSLPKDVGLPLLWDVTNDDEKLALGWIKGTMVEAEMPDFLPEKESISVEHAGISLTVRTRQLCLISSGDPPNSGRFRRISSISANFLLQLLLLGCKTGHVFLLLTRPAFLSLGSSPLLRVHRSSCTVKCKFGRSCQLRRIQTRSLPGLFSFFHGGCIPWSRHGTDSRRVSLPPSPAYL